MKAFDAECPSYPAILKLLGERGIVPLALVFSLRTNPVSRLCKVTLALATAAPLGSNTVPNTVPVTSA